jgi:primosomal protein N''
MFNQQLYHDKNPLIKKYVLKETNKTLVEINSVYHYYYNQLRLYQFKNNHIVSQIIDISMSGHYKTCFWKVLIDAQRLDDNAH